MLQALARKKAFLKKANGKKGFTLVELVVVIAILAILAAIAIPTINNLIEDANKSTDMANAQTIEVAIKTNIAQVAAKKAGADISGALYKHDAESPTLATLLTGNSSTFNLKSDILTCQTKDYEFYYDPATGVVTPRTAKTGSEVELTTSTALNETGGIG